MARPWRKWKRKKVNGVMLLFTRTYANKNKMNIKSVFSFSMFSYSSLQFSQLKKQRTGRHSGIFKRIPIFLFFF